MEVQDVSKKDVFENMEIDAPHSRMYSETLANSSLERFKYNMERLHYSWHLTRK